MAIAKPAGATKLFGRRQPLYQALGGGTVADVLLWRKREASASILITSTIAWFLFEVFGYSALTLSCHMAIAAMLICFFWSNAAAFIDLPSPKIPAGILSERSFDRAAIALHKQLTRFIKQLHDIASGKNLSLFIKAITYLWLASVTGTCFSTLTLLYLVVLCCLTLPVLYEKYEDEVEYLAAKGREDLMQLLASIKSDVLNKIPRGNVKE